MEKNCKYCQKEFRVKPSHFEKKFYCSRACMSSDYKNRMRGENNPNWKDISKPCTICGNLFVSYMKTSKYCSQKCAGLSEQNIKKLKVICNYQRPIRILKEKILVVKIKQKTGPKPKPLSPNKVCEHCNNPYHAYNKNRKYCSVKCSHDSGTPQRAGDANVLSMKKYGAKKDANHNIISTYLEYRGCFVKDLSGAGCGVPDMIVWVKTEWVLVEIKNMKTGYGKRGLNKRQKEWAANWKGGKVYLVTSTEDAELLATRQFDKLKSFPTDP